MPATATTSILSRCFSWFSGKFSKAISAELVEETEESRILAPILHEDAPYPFQITASNAGAALALPQHSPLDRLEHALLCTAQGVAAMLPEPQTAVLRSAVAIKVTIVEIVELAPMAIEILLSTPTISLTPPTPTKGKPKAASRSFAPLQSTSSAAGTLRPSGRWHGKKLASRRRVHDKENLAPATPSRPLKTREERLKAYTPPARSTPRSREYSPVLDIT